MPYWWSCLTNKGDYNSKYHPIPHHIKMRPSFVKDLPSDVNLCMQLQGCDKFPINNLTPSWNYPPTTHLYPPGSWWHCGTPGHALSCGAITASVILSFAKHTSRDPEGPHHETQVRFLGKYLRHSQDHPSPEHGNGEYRQRTSAIRLLTHSVNKSEIQPPAELNINSKL